MKKVFIVTAARSEFGILKNIIVGLSKNKKFVTKLVVTGSHLISKYGSTINEIKKLDIKNILKIKIQMDKTSSKSSSNIAFNLIKKLSSVFERQKPDIMIVFGDRFETLAISYVSFLYKIPIFHIGGGETTEGSSDESIRHAVSKLSSYHFVTHDEHKRRLIQLGENKKNIFIIGSPGIDNIKKTKLLTKKNLENLLKIKFLKKNIVVNFYPLTNEKNKDKYYIKEILNALKRLKEYRIIFTLPAFDIGSDIITNEIKKFVKKNKNSYLFKSLGSLKYFSLLKYSNIVIGNSSSGLIEAPIIGTKVINIGKRQNGRISPGGIINISCNSFLIYKTIIGTIIKNIKFEHIYPSINSSKRFVKILENIEIKNALNKKFGDLNFK